MGQILRSEPIEDGSDPLKDDSVSAILVHGIDQKGVPIVPPSAHSQTT